MVFLFLKIEFVIANSADLDEIRHSTAFHLGLHCFAKYLFTGIQNEIRVKDIHFMMYLTRLFNSNWESSGRVLVSRSRVAGLSLTCFTVLCP